jgi:lipopolysaccharide assembly outer membrane protein LptD (OstA)
MKKIAYVIALLPSLSLKAYDSEISAKEVLYLPEEEKIELIGDISIAFDGWTFLAERGKFHIEEKKLFLQGGDNNKASFSNAERYIFGEANYIEVTLSQSINLLGDAILTSDSENIKSNKINYKFPK